MFLHLDETVEIIKLLSIVNKINTTCSGGSSNNFNKALEASILKFSAPLII